MCHRWSTISGKYEKPDNESLTSTRRGTNIVSKKVLIGAAAIIVVIILVIAFQTNLFRSFTASPDFEISASQTTIVISQGYSGTIKIGIRSINGFNSPVDLGPSGPWGPGTVVLSWSDSEVVPPANGQETTTLTINVSASASITQYKITVTGTSNQPSRSHSIDIWLTVISA